jgi:hypothetical protein
MRTPYGPCQLPILLPQPTREDLSGMIMKFEVFRTCYMVQNKAYQYGKPSQAKRRHDDNLN